MERSFGVIPLRKGDYGWEIYVIHQKHGDFWGFPKGHSDAGEGAVETAARELKEETGLEMMGPYIEDAFTVNYAYERNGEKIEKQVTYYCSLVEGEARPNDEELFDGKWIQIDEAEGVLTHSNSIQVAKDLKARLEEEYGTCDRS